MTSWLTDRPGGFTEAEIAGLRRLLPRLGLAYKAMVTADAGRVLVETYLGRDAGRRVLRGAIARGEAETLRTVLWYSDLVGFTRIADSIAPEPLIALLNDYCERLAGAVRDHGGQVLTFIGDGILATFSATADEVACGEALDAAVVPRRRIDALSAERRTAGQPTTDFRLGLHLGEVAYGNVGAEDRLDFTVVGPAVNEVARIEAMCRALDQPILMSAAFAAAAGHHRRRLVSVGRYALRGVRRQQELFTLDPEA
jgi:adenylate cyclase